MNKKIKKIKLNYKNLSHVSIEYTLITPWSELYKHPPKMHTARPFIHKRNNTNKYNITF
jgi:hypothetical protein